MRVSQTYPPHPWSDCPVCGHAESSREGKDPDECGGFRYCTFGSGDAACQCWRDWPAVWTEGSSPTHSEGEG